MNARASPRSRPCAAPSSVSPRGSRACRSPPARGEWSRQTGSKWFFSRPGEPSYRDREPRTTQERSMYVVGEEEIEALARVIRSNALFRYGIGNECDRFEE